MPNRCSIARPSNQCLIRLPPASSNFAGVTRTSEPLSHGGSWPRRSISSSATSSSRSAKPASASEPTAVCCIICLPLFARRSVLYHPFHMTKRDIRLTPTSYIVLGLISAAGKATPYDLKQMHASGIGGFWTLNHAQLYAEPDRLVEGGYLKVEREDGGRRRKLYELTSSGEGALRGRLANPGGRVTAVTDGGLVPLFFCAEPGAGGEGS